MSDITLRNENGQILASSREVADRFSKNHKEVLRSIKNISKEISTAQFCALFKPSTYKASNGKSNPEYLLTTDACILPVTGHACTQYSAESTASDPGGTAPQLR